MGFEGREDLLEAMAAAEKPLTTAAQIEEVRQQLQQALDVFLVMEESATQPKSPDFAATDGWQTKVGTFTGGDQRTATKLEKTCWNAWWSNLSASEGLNKTMEIRQQIDGLPEGIYSLECKALTEHYCLSDQHGFLQTGTQTIVTPYLTRNHLDIPNTPSAWQTLTTTPIYVPQGGSVTIGFTGSKQGAIDYAWRTYGKGDTNNNKGDLREGWWCATDFHLLFHPVLKRTLVAKQWGVICLPYSYRIPEGMKLYRIAGLHADYTKLCLEEVDYAEAAIPYIYMSENADVTFYANGQAAKSPSRNDNNLRGTFEVYGNREIGNYLLKDGVWTRLTAREKAASYSGYINKAEGMEILTEWDGVTMPIVGVENELGPSSIESSLLSPRDSHFYDLQGRSVGKSKKGVVIQTDGKGKSRKQIRQ
jgi:hypothetical protein